MPGVHANGYLGYGDSLTLKLKTRLDNLGSEDTALDASMFDAEGKLLSYKDQLKNIAAWDSDNASVYITAHATDLEWMEDPLDLANLLAKPEKGWLHTFTGDVEIPEGVTPIEGVLEKGDTREGWWTTGIDVTVDPDDANDTIPGTPIKVENSTKEVEKDNYITDKDGNQVIDPDNPTVTETVATRVVKGTVTKNGKTLPLRGMKAKTPHDWNPVVGMQFNVQSVSRFYREGILAEDVFSADGSERADYDLDGSVNETTVPPTATNYDDLYVAAETGSFRIRKPMTSVRADTAKLRKLLANNDMGIFVAGDVANKGENDFYITQAINTGGAVNSFIVDWQVPYWATLEGTVLDAPLESPTMAVGRVDSLISSISTGVWEIPGAEYSCAYNYIYEGKNEDVTAELTENGSITRTEKRTEIEFGKPVDKMVAITYTLDSNGNVLDENGKVTSNFKVTRHRPERGGEGRARLPCVHVRAPGRQRPHRGRQWLCGAERHRVPRRRELRAGRHRRRSRLFLR